MASQSSTKPMTISLSAPLKRYVESKVSSGDYTSASDVMEEALREKYEREQEAGRNAIDALLIRGLESGEPIAGDDAYFERKESAYRKRMEAKQKKV